MFEKQLTEQQNRPQLTKEEIARRFSAAPFGEKSKAWARRWLNIKSYGQVRLALFDLPLIIDRAMAIFGRAFTAAEDHFGSSC